MALEGGPSRLSAALFQARSSTARFIQCLWSAPRVLPRAKLRDSTLPTAVP